MTDRKVRAVRVGTEGRSRSAAARVEGEAAGVPAEAAAEFHSAVEKRAYELHLEHGRNDGHALDDWLEAEEELRNSRVGARDQSEARDRP